MSGPRSKLIPIAFVAVLTSMMSLLSGCETSEGFGRDLQSLGENVEDEAQEAQ